MLRPCKPEIRKENIMNLIDRYVSEIGKHLPRKSRADIETEIRSTLEDMLEERAAKAGRPVDDEMVKELLKEYGAPDKVAATYLPEQYLIGPKLFPIFLLVAKIVFTVITVLAIIGTGIKIGVDHMSAQAAAEMIVRNIFQFFGSAITAFGNLVLVFAILERVMPKSEYENVLKEEGWDPGQLSKEPDPDEVRIWEPIVTIAFTLLALLVFNLYPQVLGIGFFADGKWTFIPALSEAFFRMLPWLNVAWILGIGLQVMLLRQGRWTLLTRWFDIGLKIVGIVIAYVLLKGPSILALTAADLTKASINASAAATLVSLLSQMVTIALVIAVIVGGIEVVKDVYKLLFKSTPSPLRIK
jgi:hypothetical protein